MMSNLRFLIVLLVIHVSVAPPVTKEDDTKDNEIPVDEKEFKLEYDRYMTQVVSVLETDPEFRKKLENATKEEILSGKIADELEFVNHTIRSHLDEFKRIKLDRLGKLYLKMKHEEEGLDIDHLKIKEHVDHENPHTFEIRDLKKLISKVTKDLEEVDKKRREKFKEYEMEKQFEQEEKMKQMNEEDKKKYEHEIDEMKKKHKEHEPLNRPGSKKQLEEVWEKQDHMEQEFDPKTFFYLHDLNGDGVWDQNELKALFLKELDKLYAEGHPEDDLMERAEELERMREHVLREADVNRDGFISYQEFLDQSKKTEYEKDPQWESLDQQQIYSEQEYENYKHRKEMEIQQAISRGMFPAHPNNVPYQQQQYHQQQQQQQQQQYVNQQYNSQYPQQGQYQQPIQNQGQFAAPAQQQQNYHPNQQPVGQGSPQQQYHQPQAAQNPNVNSQQQQQYHQQPIQNTNQQFQQQPIATQQQQQYQQQQQPQQQQYQQQQFQQNLNQQAQQQNQQQANQLNTNQIPQQGNQPNLNQIPQQTNQQPPNANNVNQAQQQNMPNPAAAQNNGHVAGQAQIASLNNAAQSH